MKIVLINKSDLRGGAAVVTYRLMHALRDAGTDARMLVVEKLSDDPYVEVAASHIRYQVPFIKERLRIYAANRLNCADLFKVDTADSGLPLWRHPLVKDADAVLLNWVNQGMLSLRGIRRMSAMGKKILWTMHDMWCMTGICHHAGDCRNYLKGSQCGRCPLLGKGAAPHDLSYKTWHRKHNLYTDTNIHFVAVSNWLADKCRQSGLLSDQQVSVIPNAFPIKEKIQINRTSASPITILMGAARLDDTVKGFDIALQAMQLFKDKYPDVAMQVQLHTFGDIRDASLLDRIALPHKHLGVIRDAEELRRLYAESDIVLSTSRYETLPGTLIEGQAEGCLPVAFDRGGQCDIIDHGDTGFLSDFGTDDNEAAANMAETLKQAIDYLHATDRETLAQQLHDSVEQKFSAPTIALKYLDLLSNTAKIC